MNTAFLVVLLLGSRGLLSRADESSLDILIIGSTHSYSEGKESNVAHEEPFDAAAIGFQLESILDGDPAVDGTVNVVFEDVYRAKDMDTGMGGGNSVWNIKYHCYTLAQYFMWPDGQGDRLENWRGESGTNWNYVIILEDPYVLANFPGMYAEAVRLYYEEISQGTAELILMSQWPGTNSRFTASEFNELAFRAGDSLGLKVVNAAKAWDTLSQKDRSVDHPTPDGAYLAASAIFETILNRSAAVSRYSYDDDIADHVHNTIQANAGVTQYSGKYTIANKFQMEYLRTRQIDFNTYGSSTESGFSRGLQDAIKANRMTHSRRSPSSENPVDLSYSRGNDVFESAKQYRVDPVLFHRTYGFPMGDHSSTGLTTMKYGIDKRYRRTSDGFLWFWGASYSFIDGTDLGIVYNMLREGSVEPTFDVRGIPVRLIWSKLSHYVPTFPAYRDKWHLSNGLDRAAGSFMFTLTTGRCPIDDEPASASSVNWQEWYGRKIGYETAWQMAHMTSRVPGFRVVPTAHDATDVTPDSSQILQVLFRYAPNSRVTVNLSVDDASAGTITPDTLTYSPINYETPQTVTISGAAGLSGTFPFNVLLATVSSDAVFNGLSDKWDFQNVRASN